jgi:hypothetical protein
MGMAIDFYDGRPAGNFISTERGTVESAERRHFVKAKSMKVLEYVQIQIHG